LQRTPSRTFDQRDRICAFYIQGESAEDIAAQLSVPVEIVAQTIDGIRDELWAGNDPLRNLAAALQRIGDERAEAEAELCRLGQCWAREEEEERIRRVQRLARGADPGRRREPLTYHRRMARIADRIDRLDDQAARVRGMLANKWKPTEEEERAQRDAEWNRRMNEVIQIDESELELPELPELPPELRAYEGLQ
jgi:hypothetical protein